MLDPKNVIAGFIIKYINEDITSAELKVLEDWIAESEVNKTFFEQHTNVQRVKEKLVLYNQFDQKKGWERLKPAEPGIKSISSRFKYAIAAILVLSVGAGIYRYMGNKAPITADLVTINKMKDRVPGGNTATLTLADGSVIRLDSTVNGKVAQQGGSKVINLSGKQLSYVSDVSYGSVPSEEPLYNIIATPPGGQYQLILPDGSKVWLNAGSSLRFPARFTGLQRRVELKGEGYFEIAPNTQKAFYVTVGDMDVQVIGTHFNIMAYEDENVIRTTLLEGVVKVARGTANILLKPGQQSEIVPATQTNRIKIQQADLQQVVAWKDGYFEFRDADIKTIMRQVARWYNVRVSYEGNIPHKEITGRAPRNTKLSDLLKVLQLNDIHFDVNGDAILVKP